MRVALVFLVISLVGCGHRPVAEAKRAGVPGQGPVIPQVAEVTVLPLAGPLASKKAEISALSWWRDQLVLCPQYPSRFGVAPGLGSIGLIAKDVILSTLDHPGANTITPRLVAFDDGQISSRIEGFEGFEAMAIHDDRVFLTVEAKRGGGTAGYLITGVMTAEAVTLDASTLVEISTPVVLPNMGFEGLVFTGKNTLLPIFEANGSAVVTAPVAPAYFFDTSRFVLGSIRPLDAIDYRITDVTSPDENGKMYALNIYWTGEKFLARAGADEAERARGIEQIIELELRADRVVRTPRPPLSLRPDSTGKARNWEGIASLPGRGFLIVTDEYPDTRLGFVPWKG